MDKETIRLIKQLKKDLKKQIKEYEEFLESWCNNEQRLF
jgi:hypothetical protein